MKKKSNKTSSRKVRRPVVVPGVVIGRVERIALPEWGVEGLKAKVDTGARTSSLHVDTVEHLRKDRVRFAINTGDDQIWTEADVHRVGRVRSSNGHMQERIFVQTRFVLGPVEKDIEISLTGRDDMNYRMLLGRLALEDDFLVDVGQRFLAPRTSSRGWRPVDARYLRPAAPGS